MFGLCGIVLPHFAKIWYAGTLMTRGAGLVIENRE